MRTTLNTVSGCHWQESRNLSRAFTHSLYPPLTLNQCFFKETKSRLIFYKNQIDQKSVKNCPHNSAKLQKVKIYELEE